MARPKYLITFLNAHEEYLKRLKWEKVIREILKTINKDALKYKLTGGNHGTT